MKNLVLLSLAAAPAIVIAGAPFQKHVKIPQSQVAPYPPMHWHSWGLFTSEDLTNEANMAEMATALISSGMAQVGYDTINIVCNGWPSRDPVTHVLQENKTLWPDGIGGFAAKLHAMDPPLKMGCYTAPLVTNCMCGTLPSGQGCEMGSLGHEALDMEFFAQNGCDHVMVDGGYTGSVAGFRETYKKFADGIANSSNPNMILGVWTAGFGQAWKWAGDIGGTYWRMSDDIYDGWQSVLRQWDTTYSVPGIDTFSKPGQYPFLDQLLIGDVPGRKGSAYGPGLSDDEAVAHMTMWVMATSPIMTCTDIRNMSATNKAILTNPEVLAIHKDSLSAMAKRIDVGGGSHMLQSSSICASTYPQCQLGPLDPGYIGPCSTCNYNISIYAKTLSDGNYAVMALNRAETPTQATIVCNDVGSGYFNSWFFRDLWKQSDVGVIQDALQVSVPAHGVRFYLLSAPKEV